MALARPLLVSLVAVLSLLLCAAAQADHPVPGDSALRAGETAALGAEHAAEHARLRALQRDPHWRQQLARASARAARLRARLQAGGRLDRNGRWPGGGQFDIRTTDGTTTFATHATMLPTG